MEPSWTKVPDTVEGSQTYRQFLSEVGSAFFEGPCEADVDKADGTSSGDFEITLRAVSKAAKFRSQSHTEVTLEGLVALNALALATNNPHRCSVVYHQQATFVVVHDMNTFPATIDAHLVSRVPDGAIDAESRLLEYGEIAVLEPKDEWLSEYKDQGALSIDHIGRLRGARWRSSNEVKQLLQLEPVAPPQEEKTAQLWELLASPKVGAVELAGIGVLFKRWKQPRTLRNPLDGTSAFKPGGTDIGFSSL